MPLTNEEFARLDAARVSMTRTTDSAKKKPFQLAIEHLEATQPQMQRAVKLIEELVKLRDKSLCFRVKRFGKLVIARVKYWASKWVW